MLKIVFKINWKRYEVSSKVGPEVSLDDYIRNVAELRGTKVMCKEGGCGTCIVTVRAQIPPNNRVKTFAVNSCLVSVLSCHGWEVITVEGIGNKFIGYNDIQTRLAKFNGTQCGYCTPGWIMNMYSLYQSKNKNLTSVEVENSFAGNMCRCTGYRPIADAFKSFAKDADERLLKKLVDLEDLDTIKPCGLECSKQCIHRDKCFHAKEIAGDDSNTDEDSDTFVHINETKMIMVRAGRHKWYKAYDLADAFKAINQGDYKLIAGNTGQGIYHVDSYPAIVIDISDVIELKGYTIDINLILGAGMPLSEMMELFLKLSRQTTEFSYLKKFYDHVDLVAHIPVRNIGTIAGNLFLKYTHNEFPSDIFLLFETVGAMITIAEGVNRERQMTMREFLKCNMRCKIIKNVLLPPLSPCCALQTYKVMPRSQNAPTAVNAGILFKFKPNSYIIQQASIVYGGISPSFVHATVTENILRNKDAFTNETLQLALKTLNEEVKAVEDPPQPSASYRKMLALTLYYKVILSLCPTNRINPIYKSGANVFKRGISHGTQTFETDQSLWPLNQPVPKLEALAQCSGEAIFANDLPAQSNEVFAAFVTADVVAGSIIKDFDTSEAFQLPGVIAFYKASDIPGDNTFTPTGIGLTGEQEELICSNQIRFFGQPAAIIVADKEKTANKAAKLVKIIYSFINNNKPLLTIDQVLKSPERNKRVRVDQTTEPKDKGNDVKLVIKGELKIHEQYHYYMELQTCVTKPTEDGMEVYSSTQWLNYTNVAIARCLKVPVNSINVIVRRVGGAYGGKLSRSAQTACAAALVTHKLGKTCRMVQPLMTNTKTLGKRIGTNCNYEIGVNSDGEIQYLNNIFYQDAGYSYKESFPMSTALHFHNCYDFKRWYIQANNVLTEKYANVWCRAPFSMEGVAMIEQMMEKIAFSLGKDSIEVRLQNMAKENNPIPEMISQLSTDANFDDRKKQVDDFNKNNRWRKRAIKLLPISFNISYTGNFNALVSIYHGDGSVIIIHGGVEMGQGINTKAAQVCGYILGISLDKISVKPSTSFISPNVIPTAASIGSECVVFATMKACQILNDRLQPIKDKMGKVDWAELISQAYVAGVDLQARYNFSNITDGVKPYNVYAVGILELEVDILTGNHDVKRVDILQDTGRSLSPEIDVAQIEGAFIMGLGYWTSENIIYDNATGKLLTDRTWNYSIPGLKDIPADMRIYFRREARNEFGVLQSKATGEPSLCLATVFLHAAREAVRSARIDAGYDDVWFDIEQPCTIENIFMAVGHKLEYFKLT